MPTQNHFERLGLPGRFSVDPAALERAYLARSREVHPDYHAESADRAAKLAESAAVNEAYSTLRDPFRRAEYLFNVALGYSPQVAVALSPAFLMQAMELRERLESAGADAGELENLAADLGALIDVEHAAVATLFDGPLTLNGFAAIRGHLNAWKTLMSLRRSVNNAITE